MREKFEIWIKENKEKISRPDKYSATISTISNHLKSKGNLDFDIYSKTDADEVEKISELYFSYEDYYAQNKKGNNMYSRSLDLYIEFLDTSGEIIGKEINSEIKDILIDSNLSSTEKEIIILSRRGQGKYRENLINLWKGCSISGYSGLRLLVASHIKPWKKSNNSERIDRYNGLLLLPNYDKLFDLGLIGFSETGDIKISDHLFDPKSLFISNDIKINIQKNHAKYLEYHKEFIFK
jgi:HNH endonuclease